MGHCMGYWPLRSVPATHRLEVGRLAAMLARVGEVRAGSIAAELLQAISDEVPVAQCTIFAYDGTDAPRIVSYADRARTLELPEISQSYAARFHPLDGNRAVMAAEERVRAPARILVHRQASADIAHTDYRRVCYEQPQIAERVALLTLFDGWRWLSVNFYRGREHGNFSAREIECIEALAPLLMQMVRLHYGAHLAANELPDMLAARLGRRHPGLSRREHVLLRHMLGGLAVDEIAAAMGVQPSSAQTYVKRIYRKLGVSGQRELTGLALQPEGGVQGASAMPRRQASR